MSLTAINNSMDTIAADPNDNVAEVMQSPYMASVRNFLHLQDDQLAQMLEPLAGRIAENPDLAAHFISQVITECINLGTDLSPILAVLLEQKLMEVPVTGAMLDIFINDIADNKQEIIEIFGGLDERVQKLMCALSIYLQINRTISLDEFFGIVKKLNLPSLPKEFYDIKLFGISNTGKMNKAKPAELRTDNQIVQES